jgi:hypothetical protein
VSKLSKGNLVQCVPFQSHTSQKRMVIIVITNLGRIEATNFNQQTNWQLLKNAAHTHIGDRNKHNQATVQETHITVNRRENIRAVPRHT